ncbi:MAG: glycosyltransferase [Acidimicrobiia bacterium]
MYNLMIGDGMRTKAPSDKAYRRYQSTRRRFWDSMAGKEDTSAASQYHRRLEVVYGHLIASGSRVIELGCGDGDLLASLQPSLGVGVDFSPVVLDLARSRHPGLQFIEADVHELAIDQTFDVVIISDLANDVWDVQTLLDVVSGLCRPETRVIFNLFNKVWQLPIGIARRLGFAQPMLKQNWLSIADMHNLLRVSGFEVIATSGEILWPFPTPLIGGFFNRFLVKLWPFHHLALTTMMVARPDPYRTNESASTDLSVSVVVPARNEAGHIEEILERVPDMGSRTELVFVEGNSTDNTLEVIREVVTARDDPNIRYYQQPGKGKGDAVRFGYAKATGDVLMILDADMTVAPEDLPRFFDAISSGTGEFINGVRLVYPMEDQAMQFLNLVGNKLFGLTFSWLLGQPVKDTLCGTKVLTRESYDKIAANREYFGEFDPFGDFDLLFGAAKLNLKIVDIPIRYRQRRYGSTNIDRWRHGVVLLRMAAFAARKLRFI